MYQMLKITKNMSPEIIRQIILVNEKAKRLNEINRQRSKKRYRFKYLI